MLLLLSEKANAVVSVEMQKRANTAAWNRFDRSVMALRLIWLRMEKVLDRLENYVVDKLSDCGCAKARVSLSITF